MIQSVAVRYIVSTRETTSEHAIEAMKRRVILMVRERSDQPAVTLKINKRRRRVGILNCLARSSTTLHMRYLVR